MTLKPASTLLTFIHHPECTQKSTEHFFLERGWYTASEVMLTIEVDANKVAISRLLPARRGCHANLFRCCLDIEVVGHCHPNKRLCGMLLDVVTA
jgi:hypothetical protein